MNPVLGKMNQYKTRLKITSPGTRFFNICAFMKRAYIYRLGLENIINFFDVSRLAEFSNLKSYKTQTGATLVAGVIWENGQ